MAQNEDWHKIVAKPLKKEKMTVAVAELLQWDPSLDAVMDMALGQGAEAFRASRCVAIVYEQDRSLFLDYLRRFVSDFGRVTQQGVRRIYGSLMLNLLERDEYRPDSDEAERLAEVVCAWSIEPGVKDSLSFVAAGRVGGRYGAADCRPERNGLFARHESFAQTDT